MASAAKELTTNQGVPTRKLEISQVPIAELKISEKNPRKHEARQLRQIQRSIRTFGFCVPPVVDQNNNVIIGAGRILAARAEGLSEVPTVRLEHLTDAQAKALMIADNRLTENSSWDDGLLGQLFQELSVLELDFSLEVTGFSIGEIDLCIEELGAPSGTAKRDDALPRPGPDVTALGDLWILGPQPFLFANALDAA